MLLLPKQFHPDFRQPGVKPTGSVEIDWMHPMASKLLFYSVGSQDMVSGSLAEPVNAYGPTLSSQSHGRHGHQFESHSTTDGGFVFKHNDNALSALVGTKNLTIAITIAIDSVVPWAVLSANPTNISTWSAPFANVKVTRKATTTRAQMHVTTLGLARGVDSDVDYLTFDGKFHTYVFVKTDQTSAKFYRDGKLFGGSTTDSSFRLAMEFSSQRNIYFMSRNDAASGEGLNGRVPLCAWWAKEFTASDVAEFYADPYAMLKPRVPAVYFTAVAGGSTTQITLATTRTRTVALSTTFIQPITLSVTRTRSSGLVKQTGKTFPTTRTRSSTISKTTSKAFPVTRTRSSSLSSSTFFEKLLAVTRTRTAAIIKGTSKTLAVIRTRTAAIVKGTSKTFPVTRTRTVAGSFLPTFGKIIAVTRTRTAVVAATTLFSKTINVIRTRTAAITKGISKTLAVTRTRTAAITKGTSKTFPVTRTRSVSISKMASKIFAITRTRSAVVAATTLFVKAINVIRTRSAAITTTPTFVKIFAVTRTRTATISKMTRKVFSVARTRSTNLIKGTSKLLSITRNRTIGFNFTGVFGLTIAVTRTRSAVVNVVPIFVNILSVIRTRAISLATDFIAGAGGPILQFARRSRLWRRHR